MKGARYLFGCGVGSVVLSLVCTSVGAQTIRQGVAPRVQSIEGVDTYKAYCAVCHGAAGKGDGPAATALKKVPADLTGIAKRHGGNFSTMDVEQFVLGKTMSASHGTREMPMWGPVFDATASDPTFVKLRVANLINYLKSIQAP